MLFGVVVGGAAALLVMTIARSGSWGRLVLNAPDRDRGQREEPAQEPPPVTEVPGDSDDRVSLSLEGLVAFALTHQGRVREENQDRFVLQELGNGKGLLAVVADGMGGHSGGSVASGVASATIQGVMKSCELDDNRAVYERLVESFNRADEAIRHRASKDTRLGGMGTTAVAAIITRDFAIHAHTGDSRLYHFREGREVYRTRDHSVVRYLQEEGLVSEHEARSHPMRSRLTSSLGGSPPERKITVEPRWKAKAASQQAVLDLRPGDVLVLCSDGLNSEVEPEQMGELARRHAGDARALAEGYVEAALAAGGRDNVTVIVVRRT